MKLLPTEFQKYGDTLTQIKREGMIAIFERNRPGYRPHWEVIRVQSHNGREIAGNVIPPSEYYPLSETWGTHGFTCQSIERAQIRFSKMIAADKQAEIRRENKRAIAVAGFEAPAEGQDSGGRV